MKIVKERRLYLLASFAVSAVVLTTQASAQQQGQQISDARRAAIQRCVQQAHQRDSRRGEFDAGAALPRLRELHEFRRFRAIAATVASISSLLGVERCALCA
jgi:hypothetical protein